MTDITWRLLTRTDPKLMEAKKEAIRSDKANIRIATYIEKRYMDILKRLAQEQNITIPAYVRALIEESYEDQD